MLSQGRTKVQNQLMKVLRKSLMLKDTQYQIPDFYLYQSSFHLLFTFDLFCEFLDYLILPVYVNL
jgi:hypothetical protein